MTDANAARKEPGHESASATCERTRQGTGLCRSTHLSHRSDLCLRAPWLGQISSDSDKVIVRMSRLAFAVFALAAPADAAGDAAADLFAHGQAKKASLADSSPALLPYFNNGLVFGLPGTDAGDFWHRTQLTGDWGGARTRLSPHGEVVDL